MSDTDSNYQFTDAIEALVEAFNSFGSEPCDVCLELSPADLAFGRELSAVYD